MPITSSWEIATAQSTCWTFAIPPPEPIQIGCQPDGGVIKMACSADGRLSRLAEYRIISVPGTSPLAASAGAARTSRLTRFHSAPIAIRAILSTRSGELIEVDLADGRTVRTLACYRSSSPGNRPQPRWPPACGRDPC